MAINVSVQYSGVYLLDIILLTLCYYHRGTRLNVIKSFRFYRLSSQLNILTIFPPSWVDAKTIDMRSDFSLKI